MSRIQAEAEWPQKIKKKIKKTFEIIEGIKKNPGDNPIEAIQEAIRRLTYAFFKNGLYLSQSEMGNISHNNQTLSELVNSDPQISSFSKIWTVQKKIYAAKKWLKHELKRTSKPDQTPFVTIFSSPELQRLKVILYGIRNTILAYQENKEYYRPDNVPLFTRASQENKEYYSPDNVRVLTGFDVVHYLKETKLPLLEPEPIFNAVSQLVNQYKTNDTLTELEINNIIQNREERLDYELLDTELEQSPLYIILEAISVYNPTQNLAAKKELAAGNDKEEIITIFKNSGKSIITEVITTREDINVGLKNFEKKVTEAHEDLVAACFNDSTTESDLADRVHELQTLYIEACARAAAPSGSNTPACTAGLFDNPVNPDDESNHSTESTLKYAPRHEG